MTKSMPQHIGWFPAQTKSQKEKSTVRYVTKPAQLSIASRRERKASRRKREPPGPFDARISHPGRASAPPGPGRGSRSSNRRSPSRMNGRSSWSKSHVYRRREGVTLRRSRYLSRPTRPATELRALTWPVGLDLSAQRPSAKAQCVHRAVASHRRQQSLGFPTEGWLSWGRSPRMKVVPYSKVTLVSHGSIGSCGVGVLST